MFSHSRKDAKTYGTTNLSIHLKTKHTELHAELEKKIKEAKEATVQKKESQLRPSHRQLSLVECEDKIQCWSINDYHAQSVHSRIGEMIALDRQSFSIVDNESFISLIKELEPRYICQAESTSLTM